MVKYILKKDCLFKNYHDSIIEVKAGAILQDNGSGYCYFEKDLATPIEIGFIGGHPEWFKQEIERCELTGELYNRDAMKECFNASRKGLYAPICHAVYFTFEDYLKDKYGR